MDNYRQLLQELMDAIDSGIPVDRIRNSPLAVRIDAALEQSEPEEPSGDEIYKLALEGDFLVDVGDGFTCMVQDEVGFARAVLARWGRPVSAPVEGEVAEIVELLRESVVNDDEHSSQFEPQFLARIADLLERQAAPVPVAVGERLPQLKERDSDECCWWFHPETDDTLPVWVLGYGNDEWETENPPSPTHWLPAHALPRPTPEVQP